MLPAGLTLALPQQQRLTGATPLAQQPAFGIEWEQGAEAFAKQHAGPGVMEALEALPNKIKASMSTDGSNTKLKLVEQMPDSTFYGITWSKHFRGY